MISNCMEMKEYINKSVPTLFNCHENQGLLVITTPFSYPDGDDIELYVEFRDNYMILSDMGETLRYLDTYLLETKTSKRRKTIINDVIRSNNLRINKGVIYAIIKNNEKILDAMFNMSQAIIRISDLLFTTKGQSLAAFEEEVKEFLDDNNLNYEQDFQVETPSNNKYTFEFAVENKKGIYLIKLMNAPKTQSQKTSTDRIVRIWFDISTFMGDQYPKEQRITIIDDTYYKWDPKDYKIIEPLSYINRWTQKDAMLAKLKKTS